MSGPPSIIIEIGSGSGSEILAGLIGILGAVLGSIVAVVGSEVAAGRNRARDLRSRNAALSFAIYQKITFIYSDATTLRRTLRRGILEHALEETRKLKLGRELDAKGNLIVRHNALSSYVLGWANPPSPISFTTDETWVAKDVSSEELLNVMMSLDRSFNALQQSAVKYSDERKEATAKIRVDNVDGIVVTMAGEQQEFLAYMAAANMLDQMVLDMHEMAEELVQDAFKALKLLVEADPRPFGNGRFELKNPDGDDVVLGGPLAVGPSSPVTAANYR